MTDIETTADTGGYVTIDAFERPAGGFFHWSRRMRAALAQGVDGLHAATAN